jgi:hypothetical protein
MNYKRYADRKCNIEATAEVSKHCKRYKHNYKSGSQGADMEWSRPRMEKTYTEADVEKSRFRMEQT